MTLKKTLLSAAFVAAGAAPLFANANPVLTDLTTNDFITVSGLDWAWAGPITSEVWFGANTLYQAGLHAGWREATDLEWANRPDYTAFGTKCASKYWNSSFTHCDFGDILSQHWIAGPENAADLWYVRSLAAPAAVPEPDTAALMGIAWVALAILRKRKTA